MFDKSRINAMTQQLGKALRMAGLAMPEPAKGKMYKKTAARLCYLFRVELQVSTIAGQLGFNEVRKKVMNWVEGDLKKRANKYPSTERILEEHINQPEFMKLWEEMGLDESHLEALIRK